jgi:transcriptional regulator with XRE-family HTH domain
VNNNATTVLGLASRFRGLYNRVARALGVNPSYVSRVARGERHSDAVQAALSREMTSILSRFPTAEFPMSNGNKSARSAQHGSKRKERSTPAKPKNAKDGFFPPRDEQF